MPSDLEFGPSQLLVKASNALTEVNSTLLVVQQPMSSAAITLNKVDEYMRKVLSATEAVESILKLINIVLTLAKRLGKFVPDIGPIISNTATAIEDLHLEDVTRKVLKRVDKIITKARDEFLVKLRGAVAKISKYLDLLVAKIPIWQHTFAIMAVILDFVKTAINVAGGGDVVQRVRAKLDELTGGISHDIGALLESFKPLTEFISTVWAEFVQTAEAILKGAVGSVIDALSKASEELQKFKGALDLVDKVFAPFYEILDALSWLMDHTINKLVDWVLEKTHLKDILASIADTLKNALGLTSLENEVKHYLEDLLGNCVEHLEKALNGDKSLLVTFEALVKTMYVYKDDPAGALIEVVSAAVVGQDPDPSLTPPPPVDTQELADALKRASQPSLSAPGPLFESTPAEKVVQRTTHAIDTYVSQVNKRLEGGASIGTLQTGSASLQMFTALAVPNQTSFAPKLSYATYQDQSLSVLIRTSHVTIKHDYSSYASAPLPGLGIPGPVVVAPHPLTQMKASRADVILAASTSAPIIHEMGVVNHAVPQDVGPGSPVPTSSTTPSDAISRPGWAQFKAAIGELEVGRKTVNASLETLQPALVQADGAFRAFHLQSADFADHLIAALTGFNPLLEFIHQFTDMIKSYGKSFAKGLANLAGDPKVEELGVGLVEILGRIFKSVDIFIADNKSLVEKATMFKEIFIKHGALAQEIAQGTPYAEALGPLGSHTSNLTSFMQTLSLHLEAMLQSFIKTERMVDTIFAYHLDKPNPGLLDQLDTSCSALATAAEELLNNVDKVPSAVNEFHSALHNIYSDLQVYYQVAGEISSSCQDVEIKLIAADHVSDFCARVNVLFTPFRAVLDTLGFKPTQEDMGTAAESHVQSAKVDPRIIEILRSGFSNDNFNLSHWLRKTMPDLAAIGIDKLAEKHFGLKDVDTMLNDCTKDQSFDQVKQHIGQYKQAINNLCLFIKPSRKYVYSPNATTHEEIENALFDDATSKQMASIVKIFVGLAPKGGDSPAN